MILQKDWSSIYAEDILARIPRGEIVKHEQMLKGILHMVDPKAELTIAGLNRRGKSGSGDNGLLKSKNFHIYKFIEALTKSNYLHP